MTIEPTLLGRRQVFGAAIGAGAVLLGGARILGSQLDDAVAATACSLTPEQEEGPFYVSLEKIRSNITGSVTGVPLKLAITIIDSSTCKPLTGAAVDIWQANAVGTYSDESSEGTVGQTWLRGVQLTNAQGLATFTTIYPGFYAGRAPHIHAKVHIGGSHAGTKYSGGHVSHNGQIFFPEALSTKVYATSPYTSDTNERTYRSSDRVYSGQGGSSSVLKLTGGSVASALTGKIALSVNTAKSY
ncbi:MAG TPA: intradiol ring-cleavage dioxygenase [Gaiellales bacterium]